MPALNLLLWMRLAACTPHSSARACASLPFGSCIPFWLATLHARDAQGLEAGDTEAPSFFCTHTPSMQLSSAQGSDVPTWSIWP